MALKIKLQRTGKGDQAYFRIIASEEGKKITGKMVDLLGTYHKKTKSFLCDKKKLGYWLSKGAILTEPIRKLVTQN